MPARLIRVPGWSFPRASTISLPSRPGAGQPWSCDAVQNLSITGPGAVWMFHGLLRPMTAGGCRGLSIRGLTIDYARPPFSIGEVVAVEGKTFDVAVWDEFPVKGGEPVQAFMDYDPQTRLPRKQGLDVYHSVERTELIRPQVLRVHLKNKARIEPGCWAVLRHQVYSYDAFYLVGCENVRLTDITVYTVPGMGVYARDCRNVLMDKFKVLIKPETKRLISTTADGCHFKFCQGLVQIKDCVFEGMGDDAVNVGGLYLTVNKREDDRTILAAHRLKMPVSMAVGDEVEFYRSETLLSYATGRIKTIEDMKKDGLYRLQLAGKLPDDCRPGDVLADATKTPRLRIDHCTVRNNRARGFLIQTRDAVIENCTFENCTSGGVWVMTEVVYFNESIPPRKVTIRNNTFTNCNYGGPIGDGVLSVFAFLADFKYPPEPGVLKDIVLENNVITGSDNAGIFVTGADGIVIRNNRLEQVCRQPKKPETRAGIFIMSSRNVELAGNEVIGERQGASMEEACRIGPGCETETIRKADNKGF